jgi:hypothetical protein
MGLSATVLALLLTAGSTSPVDSYAACVEAGYPVTDSNPPVCRAGQFNFTGQTLAVTPTPVPVNVLPFELLVDGDTHTSLPTEHHLFINNGADWQAYWRRAHAGVTPFPPIIAVDFSKHSILAAGLGPKPTGGYNIKFTSVTTGAAGTTVYVTETTPAISCALTQAITNKYDIIRTAKLTEPVSFRRSPATRTC